MQPQPHLEHHFFIAIALVISAVVVSCSVYFVANIIKKNSAVSAKEVAVQGCFEVAQSSKNTTSTASAQTGQYVLHEVSFNQDMFTYCLQQKGY